MKPDERCCNYPLPTNSIRHLILLLSFGVVSSLFANIVVYSLVALYSQELLLLEDWRGEDTLDPLLPEHYLATTQETVLQEAGQVEQRLTRAARAAGTPLLQENSAEIQPKEVKSQESSLEKAKSEPNQRKIDRLRLVTKVLENSEEGLALQNGHPIVPETTTITLIPPRRTRQTLPVRILTKATATPASGPVRRPSLASPSLVTTDAAAAATNASSGFAESIREKTEEVARKESISMPEDKNFANFNVKQPNMLEKNEENEKEASASDKKGSKSRLETSLWEDYPPASEPRNFESNSSSPSLQPVSQQHHFLNLSAQLLVFAGPGLGMLLAHYPTTLLLRRFRPRRVIAVALLLSGSLTAALPFVAVYGKWALVALRLGLGVCFTPTLSFIGSTAANWGSITEQLWFVNAGLMALQMAPILSWLVTIRLGDLSRQGLLRVFGVHASVSAVLLIVWLLFYRDTPQKHRAVNGLELNKIVTGKAQHNRLLEGNASSLLLKSSSAWVIWLSSFGYFFAFSMLTTFLPIYWFKVLNQRIDATIVIPVVLMMVSHYLAYLLTNCLGSSSTLKVRLWNTAALLSAAVCFVALAAMPPTHYFAARSVWLLWICLLPLGLTTAGFLESAVVCARFYAQFIVANMQVPFGLAMFTAPLMVLVVVDSRNSLVYWRLVFLGVGAVLCLSAAVFAILGRGQPSGWARNSWADPSISHKTTLEPISRYDDCGLIEMKTIEEFQQHHHQPTTALLSTYK